jgi:hypothetical protein
MKKSVKKRVRKYGKSKSVQKSAKLVHLTFKVRGLLYSADVSGQRIFISETSAAVSAKV